MKEIAEKCRELWMIFKLGIFLNKDKKYQHLGNQSKMNKNENTLHKISFHTSS